MSGFQDWILTHYDWIRGFHLIAVMAWMAGMLYLPRLYVYHAEAEVGGELSETLKIMERRLLRAIINPAMIVALILGLLMIWGRSPEIWSEPWFHLKLLALILLFGMHGFLARWRKAFLADQNKHSHVFYRVMNEVPTVLMVVIVLAAVVERL